MLFANNALSAKAKSMYGKRLKEEDYQELLRKRTISEITSYLKSETEYHEVLKDVHENTIHRGQLEALLKRDSFLRRLKLLHYADIKHDKFYQYSICLEEIEQILSCIRALTSKDYTSFVSDLPLFMNSYMSFDISLLLQVNTFKDLRKVLEKTIYYEILNPLLMKEDSVEYSVCETVLKRFFYERQREIMSKKFHGKLKKELNTIFDTQIELQNVCKIYRMKEYFNADKEDIMKTLVNANQRFNKDMYENLLEAKDGDSVLKLLETSPYKMYIDDKEFVYIEYYCQRINYFLGKRYMHFSSNAPLVYLTYFILDEIEVENIINIIEGIRYSVSPEKIESLLIY